MKFTRLVRIECPPTSRDAVYNTITGDWTPLAYEPGSPPVAAKFAVEWMPVMPSRGESTTQGLNVNVNRVRLRMRYRSDVDASMRVVLLGDGEDIYQIVSGPAPIEGRKHRMELMLEKFSTAGGNG